ncbi:hypothetical protein ACFQZQ_06855 [Lysobacter koreensis]|uniref:Flagellar protein FliT n=1 Tax=Lysobacter koreensis TaxID=266122 RepID=A0ABW2YKW0_9GAMM
MARDRAGPGLMIPVLPVAQIRAAIEAHDWALATDLLGEHQRALAAALAATDLTSTPHEPWLDLLLAQRALLGELRVARDRVGTALARLSQEHRGARAWLRELA